MFLVELKVLPDESLGAKLRVTEKRCVLFNPSTYVYLTIIIIIRLRAQVFYEQIVNEAQLS